MSNSQYGGRVTDNAAGRNDPKGWEHGGQDTLRDPKGGTYGAERGQDDPDRMKERATPGEVARGGAKVRATPASMPETLPEGLQRKRTAPGGRPEHTDDAVAKGPKLS